MIGTPIVDFVEKYAKENKARFHMPGHKGVPFLGLEPLDITEIDGADDLYHADGIILESEKNASSLFGTSRTVYSTGGSTQSIQAMLFTAFQRADKTENPFILAGRNAHKAFIYGVAKLGVDVEWLYPEENNGICSCSITAQKIDAVLASASKKPFAVYITIPDYLGGMADIKGISEVCRKHKLPLLVDNAHGAYLAFCKENLHPISLGADMCCDSAHKTLPVLTGGSYLHCAKSDIYGFADKIKAATALFGSTSPSYLVMQSLDLCNRYIDEKIREDIAFAEGKVTEIREAMQAKGIDEISSEPLKITARYPDAAYFRAVGIEPEYADGEFVSFMASSFNSNEDFEKLIAAFENIPSYKAGVKQSLGFVKHERVMSIREAMFAESEMVGVDEAIGKICAAPTVSCPPAIPIAVSGEKITQEHIAIFKAYSINRIAVVKHQVKEC
ncbi:MAG: aminotransferase class V-fold PLP-dependent enzyme [Clostridia bacterium]|nr:aminotransferase class V-fold PLP-dependent enzyme [Clostridia bacterium]